MQRSYKKLTESKDDSYEIIMAMQVPQALDDIWGALVKPAKLARWLAPVTGEMSKGGAVNIGHLARAGVVVCEPKRRLALTWQQGAAQTALDITFSTNGKGKGKYSLITLKVTAKLQDLPAKSWDSYGPAALGMGWEWVMAGLAAYLRDPKAAPRGIADFAKSPEGRAFVTEAFDRWRACLGAKPQIMMGPTPSLLVFYNGYPA